MSWTNFAKDAINQVKDSGASSAIQKWLTRELADYGEVLDFKINSAQRSAELHVMLKGETQRLTVTVELYEITSFGDEDFIIVRHAHASREWVNAILRNFVLNRKHKIPSQYSSMAKLVLNG